jgi:hypothetical protein
VPYVDVEWAVTVEGNLPSGEVWANRWTVIETDPASDIEDATTPFRTFYVAWSQICANEWNATGITLRNLVNGIVHTPTWAIVNGDNATDNPLPPEVAVRVSITGTGARHGGPFLCGLAVPSCDIDGQFNATDQTGITNALSNLMSDLVAVDLALRLDSPSDTQTIGITNVRLGRTFDVIRRRRNKIAESFSNAVVTP